MPAWMLNPILLRGLVVTGAVLIAVVSLYRIGHREASRQAEVTTLRATVEALETRREIDRGVAATPHPSRVVREEWPRP